MTTTDRAHHGVPPAQRSIVAARRGIPWWGAVLLAFAATGIGIAVDLSLGATLTRVFLAFYAAGCVAAVCTVMYRGLFAAMVQPPLVLAVAVPLVVQLMGSGSTGGLRSAAITLALPLVSGFPTMAFTTIATVLIGLGRIVHQRPTGATPSQGDPDRADGAIGSPQRRPEQRRAPRPPRQPDQQRRPDQQRQQQNWRPQGPQRPEYPQRPQYQGAPLNQPRGPYPAPRPEGGRPRPDPRGYRSDGGPGQP